MQKNSGRGFDEVRNTEGFSARCGALRTRWGWKSAAPGFNEYTGMACLGRKWERSLTEASRTSSRKETRVWPLGGLRSP